MQPIVDYSQWDLLGLVSRIEGRQVYLVETCVSPGPGVGKRAGEMMVHFRHGRLPKQGERIRLFDTNMVWSGLADETPRIPGKFRWTSRFS